MEIIVALRFNSKGDIPCGNVGGYTDPECLVKESDRRVYTQMIGKIYFLHTIYYMLHTVLYVRKWSSEAGHIWEINGIIVLGMW